MRPDHYAALGVMPEASAADIRAAYLRQMRTHHPDRNPSPESVERAKAIIAAFKVLSDFDQRSYYDWDRRRDQERTVALAVVPDRTLDKKAAVIGAVGAALVATAIVLPSRNPPIEEARVNRAPPPPAASLPAGDQAGLPIGGPGETVIRLRPVLPEDGGATAARKGGAPERVATNDPPQPVATQVAPRRDVRLVAASPAPFPGAKIAEPPPRARQAAARPSNEITSLDQFVMNFYGQSWRYGDASKRAVLEKTRASFVARRVACAGDDCRRNAYLDLMRDVSSIVETGKPETR